MMNVDVALITPQMDIILEDLRQQGDREKLVFRAEADR
jgi:hypothetical protein